MLRMAELSFKSLVERVLCWESNNRDRVLVDDAFLVEAGTFMFLPKLNPSVYVVTGVDCGTPFIILRHSGSTKLVGIELVDSGTLFVWAAEAGYRQDIHANTSCCRMFSNGNGEDLDTMDVDADQERAAFEFWRELAVLQFGSQE